MLETKVQRVNRTSGVLAVLLQNVTAWLKYNGTCTVIIMDQLHNSHDVHVYQDFIVHFPIVSNGVKYLVGRPYIV